MERSEADILRIDFDDLVVLVRKMREAQKAYFRNRSRSDLYEAKQLETEVDKIIGKPAQLIGKEHT